MTVSDEYGVNTGPGPTKAIPTRGSLRLRVRYAECDPMNVAHHASYAPWLEMGRTELLREGGVSYAQLERAGVFLVVTKLELRYRRPILYDDMIEVRTQAHESGRIKIRHSYELVLVERLGAAPDASKDPRVPIDGICAIATSELACIGPDGRPGALPPWLVPTD